MFGTKFWAKRQLSEPAVCVEVAVKRYIWPAVKPVTILLPVVKRAAILESNYPTTNRWMATGAPWPEKLAM